MPHVQAGFHYFATTARRAIRAKAFSQADCSVSVAVRIPPGFGSWGKFPVDVLGLAELVEPFLSQLSGTTAEFHAAERAHVIIRKRIRG